MMKGIIIILISLITNLSGAADKPNIVIILADDHSSNTISCYGSTLISTPNIDRLANEGMRFTNMCTTNSLCSPSRAVILSGKYSHINEVKTNNIPFNFNQTNLADQLSKVGYETSIIGKWHLTSQPEDFDYFNVIPFQGQYYDCKFKETGKEWQDGDRGGIMVPGYLTDVITELSINWLENKRDKAKPFCLMIHHKAPHSPHHPAERHTDLFDNIALPEPSTLYNKLDNKAIQELQDKMVQSRLEICIMPQYEQLVEKYRGNKDEATRVIYQNFFRGYLSLIASLDENVGRVLDYLDEKKMTDNTLVIYASDNGFFTGELGLFNKMLMYEPSQKVPFIVRYPEKIKEGQVNSALCSLIDLAPTLLDFAQSPIPGDMQGISMRLLLEKNLDTHARCVYYHYYPRFNIPEIVGIRTNRYKLIHYPEVNLNIRWELYDLKRDPEELENIWMPRKHLSKKLKHELQKQIVKYNDSIVIN